MTLLFDLIQAAIALGIVALLAIAVILVLSAIGAVLDLWLSPAPPAGPRRPIVSSDNDAAGGGSGSSAPWANHPMERFRDPEKSFQELEN